MHPRLSSSCHVRGLVSERITLMQGFGLPPMLRSHRTPLVLALLALFGVIHSPYPDGRLFTPWNLPPLPDAAAGQGPLDLAAAYLLLGALFAAWGLFLGKLRLEPPADHAP